MREQADTIEEADVHIVAIVPTDASQIQSFVEVFGPYPFRIVGDPNRDVYRAMHLKRMSKVKALQRILGYLLSGKIREVLPKHREQNTVIKKAMATQDVYQLGGTWLIDKSGSIRWQHIDKDSTDHATVSDILTAVETINGRE